MTAEVFDARNAQGAINNAQAEKFNQNFGEQTNVDTNGGDAAGRDIDKSVNINISINENSCNFVRDLLGGTPDPNRELIIKNLILLLPKVPDNSIKQALRNVLEDWPILSNKDIDTTIKSLDFRQIIKLINNLLYENDNISHPVRAQLESIIASFQQGECKPLASSLSQEARTLQSYLLIVVRPENATNKYRVNAWIIPDNSVLDPNEPEKGFKSLEIDNERLSLLMFEELAPTIEELMEKSLDILNQTRRNKLNFNLTIEVFLPNEYLCSEISHWVYTDDPIEAIHPLLLRSSQRLNRKYLRKYDNQWRKNWHELEKRFDTKPNKEDFYELSSIEECNWKKLTGDLKQKIGLKVACTLSESKRESLFQAIHNAATPIAIWSRGDIPNQKIENEIEDFLNNIKKLIDVPEWLWKKREGIYQNSDDYLGYNLSILWENPYRLPPDVTITLLTP